MRGVLAHVTEASCCNSQPSRQEALQFTAASSVMSLQHPCLAGKKKVSSSTSVADESDEDTGGGEQIREAEGRILARRHPGRRRANRETRGAQRASSCRRQRRTSVRRSTARRRADMARRRTRTATAVSRRPTVGRSSTGNARPRKTHTESGSGSRWPR